MTDAPVTVTVEELDGEIAAVEEYRDAFPDDAELAQTLAKRLAILRLAREALLASPQREAEQRVIEAAKKVTADLGAWKVYLDCKPERWEIERQRARVPLHLMLELQAALASLTEKDSSSRETLPQK